MNNSCSFVPSSFVKTGTVIAEKVSLSYLSFFMPGVLCRAIFSDDDRKLISIAIKMVMTVI